jgi:RNA polymerase sigma-70 factor (ECF subfamily)
MAKKQLRKLSEYQLVRQVLSGEPASQQELFDRYAGKMMTICLRYARHRLEAEDMLQDAFIKVFIKIDQFSFNGSFEGWVRRVVINTALKHVKKKGFSMEQMGMEMAPEKSLNPEVFSKLSVDELMEMIASLPNGYKTVFNLYAVDGYSHKEISEMLQIQESTSRSQLVKARRLLQKMVEKYYKLAV